MTNELLQLLNDWVATAAPPLGAPPDEFHWFLSRRATVLVNKHLASKKLAMLTPVYGDRGSIAVSRDAVEHCRDHRAADGVPPLAVVELLAQLFVLGNPKFAPNPSGGPNGGGYHGQLAVFDETYKSNHASAHGEGPVGILQHEGTPFVHLKLVTAYWAKPGKMSVLKQTALKK